MKKYIGFLLVFCLFIIPWSGQAQTQQELLQQQIGNWATELGAKDKRFAHLVTAELHHQMLDPVSKQWLVTFVSENYDVGYMIVGAEEERAFHLLEYGLGEYTLFDQEPVVTLPSDSSSLTPLYAGLQSVWVSKEGLFDAKSGEKYPSETQVPSKTLSAFVQQTDKLINVNQTKPTDQTGMWIKPGETIQSEKDFISHIDNGQNLTYIAHLFDGEILAPFSVVGYHSWTGVLFVELDDDGSRFVPFHHTVSLGDFFR